MSFTREEALFQAALRLETGPARTAFLDQACAGNAALRARLQALLQAHESPDPVSEPHLGDTLPESAALPRQQATTLSAPVTEKPGDKIGHYRLLQEIGEGGCGVVYMAEQQEPIRRRVAFKVIKLGMDTKQVVARFEVERQALALMDHPNIAKVLDAGATETGRPYFVMELVRGIKITDYCDQNNLSTEERLNLFVEICHAIQHAHQKGIIHRDIKPSNILVTMHDGKPVPKVIDFGIAKATGGQVLTDKTLFTAYEQFIGTPAYMSPEQAEMSGLDIDTRSDIYSLGVLLYELLTGQTPFDQKDLVAAGLDGMRRIIREKEPLRPSTRLSTLSDPERTTVAKRRHSEPPRLVHLLRGDLDWIVMKCLEKDRTRRYETANGLAQDILNHTRNEPVSARPPSRAYRVQKFVRRNKVMVGAAGLVALALVLGVVVSSWQAIRATKAGQRETTARLRADEAARVADSEKERAEKEAQKAKASDLEARRNLYAADMSLAYRAWQENNLGVALEMLNKHRPPASQPDLRGWEWRYLWAACRSDERCTLTSFPYGVLEVAVSPNGKLLAAAGSYLKGGGGVTLWEIASQRLISTPEANDAAGSAAFSPDGKLLAFGTSHHGIKLWDLTENREVQQFPAEQIGRWARGLAFSPDGHTLAAYQGTGQIVLWDLKTSTPIRTLAGGGGISSLTFLSDGQTLVSSSSDSTVRLWSVATGRELHSLTNSGEQIIQVALSPDGSTLASANYEDTVRVWDLKEKRQLKVLTNHTSWVTSVAFSPDGKTLASASADYTIKLWNTATWEEISTLRGSLHEIWCLAFSPDGKALFSGAKDGAIKVWDGTPRVRNLALLKRPADADGFGFDRSSGIAVAWHTNNTFTLWEPGTLSSLGRYAKPPAEILSNAVATVLSPSGDRLALATRQGAVILWGIPEARQITNLPWIRTEGTPSGATSPDGKRLCFVAANRLTVWNLETFEEVATLPKSAAAPVPGTLRFANDNEWIAVANEGCTVEVWNLARREHIGPWKAHRETISGMVFMPGGEGLLTSSYDTSIKLWDLETQRDVRHFGRTENAYLSVAVSPDRMRVAGGSGLNAYIRIWSAETGQEVARLGGFQGDASYLAFLADGNTLVSGSRQEVRLWRAPSWAEIEAAEARDRKGAGPQ